MTLEQIPYLLEEFQLNVSLKILNHVLVTSYVCIDMEHNGFLNDRFVSKLTQLTESGISDLSAGFAIFVLCLAVSFIVFLLEIISFFIQQRVRKYFG